MCSFFFFIWRNHAPLSFVLVNRINRNRDRYAYWATAMPTDTHTHKERAAHAVKQFLFHAQNFIFTVINIMVDSSSSSSSSVSSSSSSSSFPHTIHTFLCVRDLESFHIECEYIVQFTFSFSVEKLKQKWEIRTYAPLPEREAREERRKEQIPIHQWKRILRRCDRHYSVHQFSFVSISFFSELFPVHWKCLDFHIHFLLMSTSTSTSTQIKSRLVERLNQSKLGFQISYRNSLVTAVVRWPIDNRVRKINQFKLLTTETWRLIKSIIHFSQDHFNCQKNATWVAFEVVFPQFVPWYASNMVCILVKQMTSNLE